MAEEGGAQATTRGREETNRGQANAASLERAAPLRESGAAGAAGGGTRPAHPLWRERAAGLFVLVLLGGGDWSW